MPKIVSPWLKEVIEHNLSRPVLRISRFRDIYSLGERIEKFYSTGKVAVIAEYKLSSPSGFRVDRDAVEYVKIVEKHAVGISVLTEELYFKGSYRDLIKIAACTNIPILMKDIIISRNQIETAYNIGADAVLLIASILTDKELEQLYEDAKSFGLEAVVEIHSLDEAEDVINMGYPMIGVNARNLNTLKISLEHAYTVLSFIPNKFIKIAESGIRSVEDVKYLRNAGAKAFLIGTELMLNPNRIYQLTEASYL